MCKCAYHKYWGRLLKNKTYRDQIWEVRSSRTPPHGQNAVIPTLLASHQRSKLEREENECNAWSLNRLGPPIFPGEASLPIRTSVRGFFSGNAWFLFLRRTVLAAPICLTSWWWLACTSTCALVACLSGWKASKLVVG